MVVVELDVVVVAPLGVVVPSDVVVVGKVAVPDVPDVPDVPVGALVAVGVVLESVGALVGVVTVVPDAAPEVSADVVVLAGEVAVCVGTDSPWPVDEVAAAGEVAPEVPAALPRSPAWLAATSSVLRMPAYWFISPVTTAVICAPVMPLRRAASGNITSCRRM